MNDDEGQGMTEQVERLLVLLMSSPSVSATYSQWRAVATWVFEEAYKVGWKIKIEAPE